MTEVWRAVPGFECLYEASDGGRIRGVDRLVRFGLGVGIRRGRVLQPVVHGSIGYPKVTLHKEGSRNQRLVHRVILETFVGPRPFEGAVARHLNGDRLDNRAVNLAWGTQSENIADELRHGTHSNSNKTRCKWGHDLTPDNVRVSPSKPAHHRYCRKCMKRRNDARKLANREAS